MVKRWCLVWLIGLVLSITIFNQLDMMTWASSRCPGEYAPGVVLVGLRDDASSTSRVADAGVITSISGIGVAVVHVPVGRECRALEVLRRDPRVTFAELDYAAHSTDIMTPNDPGWKDPGQWGPVKIEAPSAWAITTGMEDVVVAVVDSGVYWAHEDLTNSLWTNSGEVPNGIDDDDNGKIDDVWGWHFYHTWAWNGEEYTYLPRENGSVTDGFGHGTHITGIVGAGVDNGVGIAGMAGGVRVMVVKVLDQYGNGWYSDIAQGIIYAVDNGAQVVNLSLGGEPASQLLQEAVDYAHTRGVLVVAATGNDGGSVLYPAACEHVLSVAATDQNDVRPSFSNHGPQVDVAAPGVGIYSTWYQGNYFTKSGTSMAAPHVSGLAALIWSACPDLAVGQVTGIITGTTTDVNGDTLLLPGWDEYVGWGRVDAGKALSATVRAGNLRLIASQYQSMVGESTVITAVVPSVVDTTSFTFTVSGGAVSPVVSASESNVITTAMTADLKAGRAIVTGTTGMWSGSLLLRVLPGPVTSTALTSSSLAVTLGRSVAITFTASDRYGNPPLNDGTFVEWLASGGTVAPVQSPLNDGLAYAAFTAKWPQSIATITADLGAGSVATTTVKLISHSYYLPFILVDGHGGRWNLKRILKYVSTPEGNFTIADGT